MKDKKIIFLHHGRVVGGAPTSLKNTILGLKELGFSHLKVLCAFPDMKPFFEKEAKVEVGDFQSPYLIIGRVLNGAASIFNWLTFVLFSLELIKSPWTLYRQIQILKQERPDIVHLNSSIFTITALAVKLLKIPLVWHVREVFLGSAYNLRKKFAGWIVRNLADEVICISEVEANSLGEDKKGNVNVVYNFIDFSTFSASIQEIQQVKEAYGLDEKPTFLSLGGVSFRKGTVEIMQAAQHMPEALFIIAGTAPAKGDTEKWKAYIISILHCLEDFLLKFRLKKVYSWAYEQRVKKLYRSDKADNVKFVGRLDFVPPLIGACDAVIFAGCTPHFPRPVYEAWAMKKTVVVFDMDGVSCNIKNGVDGVICRKNDWLGLKEGLKAITPEMGELGHPKALSHFDMKTNVQKISSIYGSMF